MKKLLLSLLIFTLLLTGCNTGDSDPETHTGGDEIPVTPIEEILSTATGTVSVWLTYTAQEGTGSNQYAIWVEDASGVYITTLYATSFTAEGGYALRENSLPTWVVKSGLSAMDETLVDAFAGATPTSGDQGYTWDITDAEGDPLPAGEYVIFIEASLRQDNRVLYRAPLTVGESHIEEADVTVEYFGDSSDERGMISDVSVTYSLS